MLLLRRSNIFGYILAVLLKGADLEQHFGRGVFKKLYLKAPGSASGGKFLHKFLFYQSLYASSLESE